MPTDPSPPSTRPHRAGLRLMTVSDPEQAALAKLLQAEHLPTDDLGSGPARFFALVDGDRWCAVGGVEAYGPHGLLRSVVVPPEARGKGYGCEMVERLLREMAARGVRDAYLLTTTAGDFFAHLGFVAIDRAAAPPAIAATAQFAALCPADAVLMRRDAQ